MCCAYGCVVVGIDCGIVIVGGGSYIIAGVYDIGDIGVCVALLFVSM